MGALKLQTKIVLYTVGLIAVLSVCFIGLNFWMDYVANVEHYRAFGHGPVPGESGSGTQFRKLGQGILFGIVLGLLGCLLGLYAGRRLSRPLNNLSRVTRDLAEGRTPEVLEIDSGDEIGQLAENFNKMVEMRKEAEASLEESRQHLLFILRENPLAYIEWGLDFRVLSWNKAAEKIFGYTGKEARGRHALDLVVPKHLRTRITDVWLKILRGEGGNFSRNENVRKDGQSIMCEWNNTVIRDAGGNPVSVASLVHDVTDVVRTQEKMRHTMEAAQKATRAKSEFLANMSHEIRTPMNGVIGLTELLLESELNPEQRSYLEVIRSSGEMLLAIINDILDLSKIESGKLELKERVFDLKECLESSFQLFQHQMRKKGLASEINLDPGLPKMVSGDPIRLRQIVYNLVGNAVKFTDAGSITLKAWPNPISARRVQVFASVTDTGHGIDPDRINAVFDPFNQADTSSTRSHGGTGLGLTICKRLCKLMRGDIRIDHTSANGTRFLFCVELQSVAAHADHPPATPPSPPVSVRSPGKGLRILLVEDNAVNRLVTKRILSRLGHDCATVNNGREALDFLAESPCEIVLMDLQMPVMDGLTATARIQQLPGPSPYIVALTASAIEGDRQRCLDAGMDDYLPKPISIHSLAQVLSRFSQRHLARA